MYSLRCCPKEDVTKNGWVSSSGDSWEEIGRRMKDRLQKCLEKSPVIDWSEAVYERKSKSLSAIHSAPFWTYSAFNWDPVACSSANFALAHRSIGRPFMRWYDGVGY